jgi:hypothetical protein
MPRKTVAAKRVKKVVKKKAASVAVRKATRPSKGKPKTTPRSAAKRKVVIPAQKAAETAKPEVSLGRPLVTQEEKLYMLFHDDYQSRQVFEFLRVGTLKELEQFTPQQIVHLMSKPIRMTVDRIRRRLAEYQRSLKDDEQFAAEIRSQRDAK